MHYRIWRRIVLLLYLLSLAHSAHPVEIGSSSRSPLQGVAALDKPVTYTETKIPLGELLEKVAADTGASLTAAREVMDEPVAVVVKEVPARGLLEQLAELLDYRWARRGQDGAWQYEIWQDLAGQQREEALRRKMIVGVAANLRDQLRDDGLLARLPPSQRQAIIDAFERHSKELEKLTPDQQQAYYYSRAGYESYRRYIAASAVAKPVAGVQAQLLGALTPEQWATLWSERSLLFSSQPAAGEFPLPEEITRQLRAAAPSSSRFPLFREVQGSVVEQEAPSEEDQRTSWATAAGYRVTVRLEASQHRSHGSLGLEASTQPILDAGESESLSFRPGDSLDLSAGPGNYDPLTQEDTPRRRAALEADSLLARRETFRPSAKPVKDADGPRTRGSWQARDLLPDLARAYGANFISDAYWRDDPVAVSLPSDAQPLYHWLDALCLPYQHWERRGDLVRLRSRTWFMERPRELPLRFARRWSDCYFDRGGLSLDDYVAMATDLKDSQLEALEGGVGILIRMKWLPKVAEELSTAPRARYTLRLYASLSPEQRLQLAAGRSLPLSRFTSTQRRLYLAALDDISVRNHAEPLVTSTLDQWGEAGLMMSAGSYRRVRMEDGPDWLRPEPPSRPAAPPNQPRSAPEAGRPVRPGDRDARAGLPAISGVPDRTGRPAIDWDAPQRSALTEIVLKVNAGPDLREEFTLTVASFP